MQSKLERFYLREYRATAIADALWVAAKVLSLMLLGALVYGTFTH